MDWIIVNDDIFPESVIVSVHHLSASEGVRESVTVTLLTGKVIEVFDDEAAVLWDSFLQKVSHPGRSQWDSRPRSV